MQYALILSEESRRKSMVGRGREAVSRHPPPRNNPGPGREQHLRRRGLGHFRPVYGYFTSELSIRFALSGNGLLPSTTRHGVGIALSSGEDRVQSVSGPELSPNIHPRRHSCKRVSEAPPGDPMPQQGGRARPSTARRRPRLLSVSLHLFPRNPLLPSLLVCVCVRVCVCVYVCVCVCVWFTWY